MGYLDLILTQDIKCCDFMDIFGIQYLYSTLHTIGKYQNHIICICMNNFLYFGKNHILFFDCFEIKLHVSMDTLDIFHFNFRNFSNLLKFLNVF